MIQKKLNILINDDASVEEVVDSLDDLFQAGDIIEDALEDGFQLNDVLAALEAQPLVSEIVNDLPVALQGFTAFAGSKPELAKMAVIEARKRSVARRGEIGKITTVLQRGLFVAASNFGFASQTYLSGQNQFMLWQTLLANSPIFPDEVPPPAAKE